MDLTDRRWPDAPDADELALLADVAQSRVWTDGPWTEQVELGMRLLTGAPHAIAFTSCTAAIHAALLALGCTRRSRVVMPALTFAGTATGAAHIGADVVFADIDRCTLTMTGSDRDADVTVAVDLHGVPHAVPRSPAGERVLTDACQSLGTRVDGRHIGWQGTHAWSFSSAKMITAPDGGAVTTDDVMLAGQLRMLRDYGAVATAVTEQDRANRVVVHAGGHNWRPSELSMAIVAHRLGRLDTWCERVAAVAGRLHAAVDDAGLWRQRAPSNSRPAWHKLRIGPADWDRHASITLERRLNAAGIVTHRWGTTPLHQHPIWRPRAALSPLACTERAAAGTFCLGTETCPPWTWTDDEIDQVIRTITKERT